MIYSSIVINKKTAFENMVPIMAQFGSAGLVPNVFCTEA